MRFQKTCVRYDYNQNPDDSYRDSAAHLPWRYLYDSCAAARACDRDVSAGSLAGLTGPAWRVVVRRNAVGFSVVAIPVGRY